MSQQQQHHSSGFLSGLLFGAVAGVAGYYFLGTEEGKKARQKLMEEWEDAKDYMVEQGVIEAADKTLPQMLQHTIQRVVEPPKRKISSSPHTIEIRSSKKKETKRFKGV